MAWNNTYVAGYRMWEADVYIARGTAGSNIFQIFKADHPDGVEATDVMIRMYEEDGGTLKAMNPIHGGFLISTGMYDRWFNLKVAHNITTHLISIYINDVRKLTVHDTSPARRHPARETRRRTASRTASTAADLSRRRHTSAIFPSGHIRRLTPGTQSGLACSIAGQSVRSRVC